MSNIATFLTDERISSNSSGVLALPASSGEQNAYIPLAYAKDCLQKVHCNMYILPSVLLYIGHKDESITYHTIPHHMYHTIPHHIIPYHTIPYHIPYHNTPYYTTPSTLYHTTLYHTISYHTTLYHTTHHTISHYIIPYHTMHHTTYHTN
jgi:hypothetical protein